MARDEGVRTRLLAAVEEQQQRLVDLAGALIRFPNENPPSQSKPITDYIADYLTSYGIESERLVAPGEHHNLIARIGSGTPGPSLILSGHSDVVPVGDSTRWSFDPFSGEVRDGYLLGRGASDMKAGLAGLIFVFALLKESGLELPGELLLAVVDDEETGGLLGARWVLEQGYLKGDACLIAEPSSPFEPTIGQKGSAWFRLRLNGRSGHGSLAPVDGDSAVIKAARATLALQQLFETPVIVPEEIQEVLQTSKEYLRRTRKNGRSGELLDHLSVNVGIIQGGTKANIVPDQCLMEVDVRVPFGLTPDDVDARVRELLAEANLVEGEDYQMEPIGFRGLPNYTVPSEPIVQAVLHAIEAVRGRKGTGVLQWASSDARYFRQHGIPVLQYGPAELSTIHGVDEKVQVTEIVASAKIYMLTVLEYLGL